MKNTGLLFVVSICILPYVQSCKKENLSVKKNNVTESVKKGNVVLPFSVSKVLGSNMVVQRDKVFKVWGQVTTGNIITVKASWNATTFSSASNAAGDWEVSIPAQAFTATAQNIVIKNTSVTPNTTITLSNILIGDVWVCSGQSNMVMPMKKVNDDFGGFNGVENYAAEIAAANYPNIRLSAIPYGRPSTPQDYLTGNAPWTVCSPSTAGDYSAIAYYFGRKLNTTLNVPIGLVVSAVSATSCQEWTSLPTIQANGYLNAFYGSYPNVSTLYNGMIYPLKKLAVKGYIWDQGEGNYDDYPGMYTYLVSAMIGNWRTIFNQGNMPFYLSGKTPFGWVADTAKTRIPRFRDYQAAAVGITTNTALAVATDVNDILGIHTKYKKPIAERLAFYALNKTYGQTAIACEGPKYASYSVSGSQVTINFVSGTATGLTTVSAQPLKQVFRLAGTDSLFRPATAVINGTTVKLTIPAGTPLPVIAVRHAYNDPKVTNLINSSGLPATSFRSDNWATPQ